MAISGDVFRINQVYELLQEGQWPLEYTKKYYGWFASGSLSIGNTSSTERIDFQNDTNTASTRGSLTKTRTSFDGAGNENYGWFGGGVDPTVSPNRSSLIDRITFTDDTNTASVRGSLSIGKFRHAATSDSVSAFFAGGVANPAGATVSLVDRIIFSNDTVNASSTGLLGQNRYGLASTENDTYAWFGGGRLSPTNLSYVDRLNFSSFSSTYSTRGPLSSSRYDLSAVGNSNYGWFTGGTPFNSIVDRIDWADDTTTASIRGNLLNTKDKSAGVNNEIYGWFGGGRTNPPLVFGTSLVERITFDNDTVTTTERGSLSAGRYSHAGVSNF